MIFGVFHVINKKKLIFQERQPGKNGFNGGRFFPSTVSIAVRARSASAGQIAPPDHDPGYFWCKSIL
mgnify:CR=1 FL=1